MKTINMEIGAKKNKLTLLEIVREIRCYQSGQRQEIRGVFQCDCGEKRNMLLCSVRTGHIKSCGCHKPLKLNNGESAFNQLYRDYQWGAKRKKRTFSLSP